MERGFHLFSVRPFPCPANPPAHHRAAVYVHTRAPVYSNYKKETMTANCDKVTSDFAKGDDEEMEFDKQERREEEPSPAVRRGGRDIDQMTVLKYFRTRKEQIDRSFEGKLEANERPRSRKRRRTCAEYDEQGKTEKTYRLNASNYLRKGKMKMKETVEGDFEDSYSSAMKLAKEIQANLDSSFPSFFKLMKYSHVIHGFWLGLPAKFCTTNLPKHNQTIVLEDENGEEYETKYLAHKIGLSAGWRGFSIRHNLLEGDVIVFHLVSRNKFKVYIVRASSSVEIHGALRDSNPDNNAAERDSILSKNGLSDGKNNTGKSENDLVENDQKDCPGKTNCVSANARDEFDNGLENSPSGFKGSFIDFHDFTIIVNNSNIDSMLTQEVLRKYYELCLAQNSYLHNLLLKSVNRMLAAGIILETVKIADCIKECKLSTLTHDFALWDKTLRGFQALGMEVGFLRSRISSLVTLAASMTPETERYLEARLHSGCVEEISSLTPKLQKVEHVRRKLEIVREVLNVETDICQLIFNEAAKSSWSSNPTS